MTTQAVILAGGQGTRLRPLTLARAKPVVPLLNRPFLAYQIALLRQHGVSDIILSCSYRVDDVRQALGDARDLGVTLRYVVEDEPLGTGGGVRNAADLAQGTIFVLNGDVLTDADLTAMRAFHEARGSRVTIFLTPVADPRAYGLVETAADGRLLRFREKPGPDEAIATNMINAGVYLIDAPLLARIPAGRAVSIEREFFPAVIADGIPSFGWSAPAYWRDIGNPAAYCAAQIDLLGGHVNTSLAPPGEARQGNWIDATASTAAAARIEAPSVVGAGAVLGPGAEVGPYAVIGPGAVLGARARVERAVLWERVRVGEGARLCDCVVGADATIGAGASLSGGLALESGALVPAGEVLHPVEGRAEAGVRVSDEGTLRDDLDRGVSLPASWYTEPELAARERERIFRRAWHYLGPAEQVARVGDFVTGTVADVPVVAVRSESGPNAFVNVCRHRRHEVVSGRGNRRTLQCPYHAWTYGLDGGLRAAPRSQHEAGFALSDYPLLPVALDTWGPFAFVNLDGGALPLAHYLGDLPSIVAGSGLDLDQLAFHDREEWQTEVNWKALIENFLECYHCPVQHPAFSAVVDVDEDSYLLEPHPWFSSQVAPVRRAALEGRGRKPAYDVRGAVTQAQYHYLWPNLTLSINPGPPNLSLDVWAPAGPERTRGVSEHWFGPDVPEAARREMIDFNRQVSREDDRLTDSVQRGLRAGLPARGRFLTRSEHLLVHFQKLILDALA